MKNVKKRKFFRIFPRKSSLPHLPPAKLRIYFRGARAFFSSRRRSSPARLFRCRNDDLFVNITQCGRLKIGNLHKSFHLQKIDLIYGEFDDIIYKYIYIS